MKPSERIKEIFYNFGNIVESDEIYDYPKHFITAVLMYLDEQYEKEKN